MIDIRAAIDSDCEGIWRIFHAVVVEGGTYAFDPDTTQEQAISTKSPKKTKALSSYSETILSRETSRFD
jgi:hypothetical protein